jgi:hypothetical protein
VKNDFMLMAMVDIDDENSGGEMCNDPKPLCQDHHGFGVHFKLFLVVVFRQTLCLQLRLGFY